MNRKIKFTLGLFFALLVSAYSQISFASEKYSSACELGTAAKSGQVAFFQHANYKGTCVIRLVGRYSNAKAIGIGNDKISSIKVGHGTQVILCNDSNFKGGCKVYATSMTSLGKMNDRTSSAAISLKQKTNKETSASCRPNANQVAFFQHANFKGACVVRNTGRYPSSKAIGIGNDKISSIKIGSGSNVNLCKDSNFRGTCKNYTRSMASLGKMNDQTSSAIISRTVPQKSPPYVPENNNTPSSTDTSSRCDEYGICICESEAECLSMGAENGPCVTNEYNEPEYACDDISCACFQSGSSAARANPGSLCEGDGFINMNGIVGSNGVVIMNAATPICSDNMTLSDTIIGASSAYQDTRENKELSTKIGPNTSPPIAYEKNETPPIKTAPSTGGGKFELSAPSDLSVDGVTSTSVTLSWMDNSDREYGVEVYRMDPVEARQNRSISWEFIGLFEERNDDNIKRTDWRMDEDFDLSPDTNYCYRLRAYVGYDRSEVSDYSKLVCAKTQASNEIPIEKRPKVTVKRR